MKINASLVIQNRINAESLVLAVTWENVSFLCSLRNRTKRVLSFHVVDSEPTQVQTPVNISSYDFIFKAVPSSLVS